MEQERYPTFGRFLCIPEEQVFRVHGTSGTTGQPSVFGIGRGDWDSIAEAHVRVLWSVGLRLGDCVMVAAVFGLYIGSWGALVGAERLGPDTSHSAPAHQAKQSGPSNWQRC